MARFVGQRVDQRAAPDAEGSDAALECGDHRTEFLRIDGNGTAAPATATARGHEARLYALLD